MNVSRQLLRLLRCGGALLKHICLCEGMSRLPKALPAPRNAPHLPSRPPAKRHSAPAPRRAGILAPSSIADRRSPALPHPSRCLLLHAEAVAALFVGSSLPPSPYSSPGRLSSSLMPIRTCVGLMRSAQTRTPPARRGCWQVQTRERRALFRMTPKGNALTP